MGEISPLRRRMVEDMTVRNLSPATQQSYLSAVSKFSRYFGRSPDRLGLEDVHVFQVHLVATGISWPALNQIVCALQFFYGVTLGQATVPERIAYAREPSKRDLTEPSRFANRCGMIQDGKRRVVCHWPSDCGADNELRAIRCAEGVGNGDVCKNDMPTLTSFGCCPDLCCHRCY